MTEFDPDLEDVARRLETERALPVPQFRGELKRHLARGSRATNARLRLLINAYAVGGTCLLAIAAAGVAGIGPLA